MPVIDKRKPVVGLDIGPKRIVAVVLKKTQKGLIITHCAIGLTPLDSIEDGVVTNPQAVGEAIKRLFTENGIKLKDVVVGCGGPGMVLHLSKLSAMSDNEIKEAIKVQLSKFVVFAGFEMASDYHIIESLTEARVKKNKILIVASKKVKVDSYVTAISKAGLNLISIDDNSLAVTRSIYSNSINSGSSDAVATVMIGFDDAVISIYKGNQLYYVHRMDQGIKDEGEVRFFLAKFISEFESVLQYYRSQFDQAADVKKVILGGKTEGISRLKKTPNEKLTVSGITMEIADPFCDILFDNEGIAQEVEKQGEALVRAIGLARKGRDFDNFPVNIDLLPMEFLKLVELSKMLKRIAFFFIGLVVCLVLAIVIFHLEIDSVKKQIERIQVHVRGLPSASKLITLEHQNKKNLDEIAIQDEFIEAINEKPWDEVLDEIKTIIPKEARLTGFSATSEGRMSFSGQSVSQETVFNFERVLKESPYFENVKLGVVQDREGKQNFVHFSMTCELRSKEGMYKK